MQRSPILSIFLIHVCAMLNQRLGDIIALLRILVKKVHDEVQRRFTIVIGLIDVGSLPYECLDQPDLQPYDRQVQRTPVVMNDSFGYILKVINENRIFLRLVAENLKQLKTQDVIEAEAVAKVADSQINLWSGQNRKFSELTLPKDDFKMKGFANKTEFDTYIQHPDYGTAGKEAVCFGFHLIENSPTNYELELMFNDQIVLDYRSLPNQMDLAADENQLFPRVRAYAYYSYFGFAYMQNWAANTVLRKATGIKTAEIVTMTVPFKLAPMVKDPFLALVYFILPTFLMLMFIPMIYRLTYRIVREKELRTKELMAEMGMQTSAYWLSWATYYLAVNIIMSTSAWVVLYFGCLSFTGPVVLFLIVFLFGQSIFGFIMLMQSFFTEARTAAVTTTIVYFGSALTLQLGAQAPTWQRMLLSLSPCACMQNTVSVIAGFEGNGVGVTMASLSSGYRNWNCALGFSMFTISFIVMNLLGVYFDNIVPRKYGKTRNCCYCFGCGSNSGKPKKGQRRRQSLLRQNFANKNGNQTDYVAMSRQFETAYMNPENYEGVPHNVAQMEEFQMLMKIADIMKTYPNGVKAVNGISVKLYVDQIFVMLGHNGAGKSSLISMLTGLYEPTQGTAEVYGIDMIKEFEKVRQFLGICPQHDVYFDLLTPREHLEIFYDFKGGEQNAIKKQSEIDGLIKAVGLTDQQHDLTSKLSGGYQRKLSCCQALVGGSKLIIMDEPTASLDLNARRQIWSMLKEYKKDRIVLLTTHYMDEADILGDRIGIMTKGKVVCLGSSMFLKKKFGAGYNLSLIKANAKNNKVVEAYFKEHLGQKSKQTSEIQTEIIMQVPLDYATKFAKFFDNFDAQMESMQIVSYGISITTLEDVFLSVGHLGDEEDEKDEKDEFDDPISDKKQTRSSKKRRNTQHQQQNTAMGLNYTNEQSSQISEYDGTYSANDEIDKTGQAFADGHEEISISDNTHHYVMDQSYHSPGRKKRGSLKNNYSQFSSNEKQSNEKFSLRDGAVSTQKSGYPRREQRRKTPRKEEDFEMADLPIYKQKSRSYTQQITGSAIKKRGGKVAVFGQKEATRPKKRNVEYSMAFNGTNNGFFASFFAVLLKRVQLWQSSKKMLYEFLLPIMIMCIGVFLTSLDFNKRSSSRLLDASRVSDIPKGQAILFDREITKKGGNVGIDQLVANFPRQDLHDFHIKNSKVDFLEGNDNFDLFHKFTYWFGRTFSSKWPFFYCAYQVYEADTRTQQYKFYSHMNLTNADAVALYPQWMYQSIMKTATNNSDFEFVVRSTPMPTTNEVLKRKVQGNSAAVIFLTAVAYGMLMTSIVGGIVWERMSGIKHIQMISGMDRLAYWVANFIVDLIQVELIVLVSVLAFYLAGLQYTTSWIIYMLFPVASIPLTYVTAFFFASESAAQTGTIFMNFGSILFGSTLVYYLRFIKEWEVIGDLLNDILKVMPSYTLGASIYFDASIGDLVEFREATLGDGRPLTTDPWVLENVYGDILSYVIHFFFWSLVLACIELGVEKQIKDFLFKLNSRQFPSYNNRIKFDSDVQAEARRVTDPDDPQYKDDMDMQVKVKNLRKVYMKGTGLCNPGEPLCAVERLTFGLEKGECFALLGVNGAGKSTTFKILTAGEEPTDGQISIQGLDMQEDFQEVRKLLGYCPQQDPIFESLTVEQNIEYFARIKGIPEGYRGQLIENAIEQLSLQDHRKKQAGTLSGGNKRKVSVAICTVGNPPIILLDEPSAGMDPEARRFMWSVIAGITSKKTSAVILTSHLMEEAEALATKMGIMVKGGIFKCFGSAQHIKDKFGKEKYEVEIKIQVPSHEELTRLAEQEFLDYYDEDFQIDIVAILKRLSKIYSKFVLDKIVDELITTYKNASINIHLLKTALNGAELSGTIKCSAVVLAEKLFTQRNMYGAIEEICKNWRASKKAVERWYGEGQIPDEDPRKIEMLEQYGNYSKLRLSKQDKTLGQMFGMIETIKDKYHIDQYSISQIKLEQIFQSLANMNFDGQVRAFSLKTDRRGNEVLTID